VCLCSCFLYCSVVVRAPTVCVMSLLYPTFCADDCIHEYLWMYMHVCIYWMCVYISVDVGLYVHIRLSAFVYIHVHLCTSVWMYVCISVNISLNGCECTAVAVCLSQSLIQPLCLSYSVSPLCACLCLCASLSVCVSVENIRLVENMPTTEVYTSRVFILFCFSLSEL